MGELKDQFSSTLGTTYQSPSHLISESTKSIILRVMRAPKGSLRTL